MGRSYRRRGARRRPPKTAAVVRRHLKRRAAERYGWDLNRQEMDEMTNHVRRSNVAPIERQSQTRSIYRVEWRGETVLVVYDKTVSYISTILPRGAAEGRLGLYGDGE